MENLQTILDNLVKKKNLYKIDQTHPDPILVAKQYKEEKISLICALFAYGKASLIVTFLKKIDFNILNESDLEIKKYFQNFKYRFQTSEDIAQFFITLKRIDNLEQLFLKGYINSTLK